MNKNKYFIALFRNEQHNRKRFIIKDQPEPETTPTKLLCIKKQVSTSEVAKNSFYELLNCQINDLIMTKHKDEINAIEIKNCNLKASLESTNKKLQDLEQERQAIAHLKLKNEQLSKELSEKALINSDLTLQLKLANKKFESSLSQISSLRSELGKRKNFN